MLSSRHLSVQGMYSIYSSGTKGIVSLDDDKIRTKGKVLSISPLSTSSLMSFGLRPSTRHPTLKAVPRISLTTPLSDLLKLLNRICRAISTISSRGIFPLCLIFFSFLRSRGGSLSARMTRDDAEGTTETWACRFWMVSLTVTRRPFQSPVA